jgi:hypothetical protein
MRRDDDEFASKDLELIFIAKKLREAKAVEEGLSQAGFDYLIETGTYSGGVIFHTQRVGAFFYVQPEDSEPARGYLRERGFRPHVRTGGMT